MTSSKFIDQHGLFHIQIGNGVQQQTGFWSLVELGERFGDGGPILRKEKFLRSSFDWIFLIVLILRDLWFAVS